MNTATENTISRNKCLLVNISNKKLNKNIEKVS